MPDRSERPRPGTVFAIPGDLTAPTGGYGYDRQVLSALPELLHLPLPVSFPMPTAADLHQTVASLAEQPDGTVILMDGLAAGALPVWCFDRMPGPVVALVHHPLCLETGLSASAQVELRQSERLALACCAHVIATSRSTARILNNEFDVPLERIAVAEPGTTPAPRAQRTGMPLHLLAVGSVIQRKAYHLLIAALAGLEPIPWVLTIAGALDRDPPAVEQLRGLITEYGLSARVVLAGAVPAPALQQMYASADIFVSASLYEGYGMAVADALAHGLPIVASAAGALAVTIPQGAALMCLPSDLDGLRHALRRMLTDDLARAAVSDASWAAGQALPRWADTARCIAKALAAVRSGGR